MGRPLFSSAARQATAAPAVRVQPEPQPQYPTYERWTYWNAFDPDSDEFFDNDDAVYEAFIDPADRIQLPRDGAVDAALVDVMTSVRPRVVPSATNPPRSPSVGSDVDVDSSSSSSGASDASSSGRGSPMQGVDTPAEGEPQRPLYAAPIRRTYDMRGPEHPFQSGLGPQNPSVSNRNVRLESDPTSSRYWLSLIDSVQPSIERHRENVRTAQEAEARRLDRERESAADVEGVLRQQQQQQQRVEVEVRPVARERVPTFLDLPPEEEEEDRDRDGDSRPRTLSHPQPLRRASVSTGTSALDPTTPLRPSTPPNAQAVGIPLDLYATPSPPPSVTPRLYSWSSHAPGVPASPLTNRGARLSVAHIVAPTLVPAHRVA